MVNILYSIAQEGRGHSSRSYEVIKRLAARKHHILVLTGGDSFEPMNEALKKYKTIQLVKIPGLRFSYDSKGKVNYLKTVSGNLKIMADGQKLIKEIEQLIEKHRINFVVSDFEPFAPRAARNKGVNFITVDNQHRFVFEKSSNFQGFNFHSFSYHVAKNIVKYYHPSGKACIISSVFIPRLDHKKIEGNVDVYCVGPIIRNEIVSLKKKVKNEDFILVYVKPQLEQAIIPKIEKIQAHFVMYVKNPSSHKKNKNITYKKHSLSGFAKDMAKCKAVISSAGESVISESLFLGKPMFLMPEYGQYEQKLNADLVQKNKVGVGKDITSILTEDFVNFIGKIEKYKKNIKKMNVTDNSEVVVDLILKELII